MGSMERVRLFICGFWGSIIWGGIEIGDCLGGEIGFGLILISFYGDGSRLILVIFLGEGTGLGFTIFFGDGSGLTLTTFFGGDSGLTFLILLGLMMAHSGGLSSL